MSVAGEKAHVQAMSSGAVVRLSWFAQCLVPPNWTTGANHPVIRMVARVTCVRVPLLLVRCRPGCRSRLWLARPVMAWVVITVRDTRSRPA